MATSQRTDEATANFHNICFPFNLLPADAPTSQPGASRSVVAQRDRLGLFRQDLDPMYGLGERLANRSQSGRTDFAGPFQGSTGGGCGGVFGADSQFFGA